MGTIYLRSLIRRKDKDSQQIDYQEKHYELENCTNLSPLCSGHFKYDQTAYQHDQKNTGIVGKHTGNGPQQKEYQLRYATQPVYPGVFFFIT